MTGGQTESVIITAKKPVNFELQRVWVTYKRNNVPEGSAFFNVSDGLGAGVCDPARFVARLGDNGRRTNRVAAIRVVNFGPGESGAIGSYRLSEATQLQLDVALSFLTEGIYTYSIDIDLLVNGVTRHLKVQHALLRGREYPMRVVFARNPAMAHEEFADYPAARWLPGARPSEPE